MNLTLKRTEKSEFGCFGELYDENDNLLFYTLEHNYENGPKISEGVYKCTRYNSPRFGKVLFMLNNVPNCSYILIHNGNYNKDSDGCILIGKGKTRNMITDSKKALGEFMKMQKDVDFFQIKVIDGI